MDNTLEYYNQNAELFVQGTLLVDFKQTQDRFLEKLNAGAYILDFVLYESCYRDNLHSLRAGQELYRKGNSEVEFMNILQKNMQPVYDSARRQGYEVWNRR